MSQITTKIIADSYSAINGKRITTFELQYPRFIHSELMTHRLFSRNAMSSRAVPIDKMIDQVLDNPAKPVHWGKNQPGMQAKVELVGRNKGYVETLWNKASEVVADIAEEMSECQAHKQIVNRILEPFQLMKTVLTATEFDNFFWLRKHEDAQPEIKELADQMYQTMGESSVVTLQPGDWHTPYFGDGYWLKGCGIPLEDALAISSSCCAQVSYRLLDDSIEKARKVYQRLVESTPVHASPFEHQASPMRFNYGADLLKAAREVGVDEPMFDDGTTHMDSAGNFWSGNFKGWTQHRQLIKDNVCNHYKAK